MSILSNPEEMREYQERMGSPEMEYLQYLSEQNLSEQTETQMEAIRENQASMNNGMIFPNTPDV